MILNLLRIKFHILIALVGSLNLLLLQKLLWGYYSYDSVLYYVNGRSNEYNRIQSSSKKKNNSLTALHKLSREANN